MKNIMVIGMDFYKDSSQKNMSVAAFVASINGTQENKLNCTRYYSKCQLQPRGQEFANSLTILMKGFILFLFRFDYQYSRSVFLLEHLYTSFELDCTQLQNKIILNEQTFSAIISM